MFAELREHWSEEQIVEIVGVIALFGFLDTMATPLEDEPIEVGQKYKSRRLADRKPPPLTRPGRDWPIRPSE
jgi:hypothetical protein